MVTVQRLDDVVKSSEPMAVALSGGTDSSVLLAYARRLGIRVMGISVDTGLNPPGELAAAEALAARLGVPFAVVRRDMLAIPDVRENTSRRCYVCKREMMRAVIHEANRRGYATVADGTHADDLPGDRPGMAALQELGIVSPFAEAGMGKGDVLTLAGELGISVRPASSCLATRIPAGTHLTAECIGMVREAEEMLRDEVEGMLRVRCIDRRAYIEADPSEHPRIRPMLGKIRELGFEEVVLAPGGYRQGGADTWKQ
ncbi:ATP-dependent sacrificial sulfur transferase LarE [Methanoculleus sp. FWC-SCC1]|uniref:ATP-dependent sacrificial sulfur transferase LarE n=1 Tax=Methanoculleus frigidifontis TaxID=2584085 RepID=A0ABT8M7N1_9EURY|nr:ATP-dependent sacrificial sulfur transferase LarE [Methanoculleus sp. FWC-SCC1]MDN7023939.1 ATP-dependent sacrificial sulfur transferase LarE [Methanoculleus sp. FWC-SCC1]